MEKKREWDREAAEEVFLSSDPYITVFLIGDEKVELLKLLSAGQTNCPHPGSLGLGWVYEMLIWRSTSSAYRIVSVATCNDTPPSRFVKCKLARQPRKAATGHNP
jgi:hypothetical protein